MRRISRWLIVFVSMVGFVLFGGSVTRVLAGTCSFDPGNNYNESSCQAASTGANNTSCGTGGYSYYSCNYEPDNSRWAYCYGCHALGPGQTPPPTPKPPAECNGSYQVNCPAGQTKTSLLTGSYCLSGANARACNGGGQNYYVGSAQRVGGQCNERYDDDGNPYFDGVTILTYSCCPNGTENQCSWGSNYEVAITDRCYLPDYGARCGINDRYISVREDQSLGRCDWYEHNCEEQKNGDIDCEYDPVYFKRITCQDYACSCQVTCAAIVPSAPTLSYPGPGATVNSTSFNLQWSWPGSNTWGTACPQPNVEEFKVYIGTNPTSIPLRRTVSKNTFTEPFVGTNGTTYYWYVEASNGSESTPATVRSFTIVNNQVAGTVYLDSNNVCSSATGWNVAGVPVTVKIDSGANVAVNGTTGAFTTTAVPGAHTITANIPANYICSTSTAVAGCNVCDNKSFTSPINGLSLYLTRLRSSWWQSAGGPVYAGSTSSSATIGSTIPDSLAAGSRYLIIPGSGGSTVGALMRSGGTAPTLGAGTANANSWSAISTYKGVRMDYAYFTREMAVLPNQDSDWNGAIMDKPTYSAAKDFYYFNPGPATISNPWAVAANEKYTIFVNGNLNINSDITVAPGGFLALIVNGSITVGTEVASIQGLYVADDNFVTSSKYVLNSVSDSQLSVAGTVAAWGTFSLGRNLGGTNSSAPSELFTYRSDLIASMPDKMKTFLMQWGEVVPGTFDND